MKKRIIMVLAALFVLAAGISAYDKGDLMLNIEPQFGAVLTPLMYRGMTPGVELGLRTTVHYYLTDFFSFNTGLGLGFNYHTFTRDKGSNPLWLFLPLVGWGIFLSEFLTPGTPIGDYFAPYVTVPLGFRLSLRGFTMGAGATFNIPIHYNKDEGEGYYESQVAWDRGEIKRLNMDSLFHMGWYIDLGFDWAGRKDKKGGFGTFLRLGGVFGDSFSLTPPDDIEVDPDSLIKLTNSFFAISLVFQFAIELGSFPVR